MIVPHTEEADVYIVNSCTVTAESDRKTRQAVRRFKRNHPDSVVMLMGCMPQAYPEQAKALTEADIVTGNRDLAKGIELLKKRLEGRNRIVDIEPHLTGDSFSPCSISFFNERTRAEIKIEDGCNQFCAYCAIPYSRGRVRSKPIEDIEREARTLAENGYTEIVLVGINLSSYGLGTEYNICHAVEAAAKPDKVRRVRLSSLEPDHITPEIIEGLKNQPKLCPHFHISLQSGCTETLKRMNRRYTADEYADICRNLRNAFPDCALTTDVMVGFFGETEEEFAQSLDFVKKIAFEKVHVFPYSVRKGTRAENFPNPVPASEKNRRAAVMIKETGKIRSEFLRRQIGSTVTVLAERLADDGYAIGYTANYTPVKIEAGAEEGNYYGVLITGSDDDMCTGTIV